MNVQPSHESRAMERAHRRAQEFRESLPGRPVWPRVGYDEMYARLAGPLPGTGTAADEVVDELADLVDPGLAGMAGGRFFGFVIGGTHPAALGADWLTTAWDQNAALTPATPAAAAVEIVAGEWLLDLLGLPAGAGVGFVTGGTMANFTCLVAARQWVLAQQGWDLAERGLGGAPAVRLVVGEHRHGSVDRAALFMGLGRADVVVVAADGEGRMLPGALADALAAGSGPVVVCLQAGEVHTGGFDPFGELIPICRQHDAWVHVDGAFGLWAAAAASTRHLTAGVAAADSWATDGHKTLNVPYDSGMAIVRDRSRLVAAFGVSADYLISGQEDPCERTPELSRRGRGFPVWAVLRSLGRDGVDALVDRLARHAGLVATGLAETPGLEVVNDVVFTQVMTTAGDDARTIDLGRPHPRRRNCGVDARDLARAGGAALLDVDLGHYGRRHRSYGGRGAPARPGWCGLEGGR